MCLDPNAVCINGRCECKRGYVIEAGTCVSTSEEGSADAPCLPGGLCLDKNSICAQGLCRCSLGHYAKEGQCCKLVMPFYFLSGKVKNRIPHRQI